MRAVCWVIVGCTIATIALKWWLGPAQDEFYGPKRK